MNSFSHLFKPIRIGSLQLANRIVMCPMGTGFATEDGMPTEQMANYYAERALGGAGLIIVEHTVVQPVGRWGKKAAGLWDDESVDGWKRVVDGVHAHNGKIAIQIGHQGRCTNQEQTGGLQPVAPSSVPCHGVQVLPHELTNEEVYGFIDDYLAAVKRAIQAGFDAIEIHGTHGFLIDQFISGKTNKRTDEFGGALRGRLRLPLEIIRRIRKEVGTEYPLLMRIASMDTEGGQTLEEAKVTARILAQEGLDALDISAGSYMKMEWEVPPYFSPPAFNMKNIEAIKDSVDIPVIGAGRIYEPDMAEQVIAEGRCDLVGLGRALIADPYWPHKVRHGKTDEIHHCIGCTRCADILSSGQSLKCTVNPFVGRETEIRISPSDRKKKIMVVGGGPAGLQCASIAAARGHDVSLFEKEMSLGGQIRSAAVPPAKFVLTSIVRWLEIEARNNGVEIRTGEEVTSKKVQEFHADAVVLANGAVPRSPDVPRSALANVEFAADVLLGKAETGKRVVIIGGGQVGCEIAHFLAEYGKSITIVEMLQDVGPDICYIPRPILLEKLKMWGVEVITSAIVTEIMDNGVVIKENGEEKILSGFDTIILASGYVADDALYNQVSPIVAESYVVGDAQSPGKIMEALAEAVEVGMQI